ncbi:MAG: hypothetical protein EAZ92_10120 [Candidatus Kapaibacterium sp.]|nr:MAG: hypothetical protein EAZ92_10120 [Candidatus Kapabacteria bacterium]
MSSDQRVIELLTDMVMKLDTLVEEMREMKQEQREMKHAQREMKQEQHQTTNAVWELSQMMQKVLWEPAQVMKQDIADLKRRMDAIEQAR